MERNINKFGIHNELTPTAAAASSSTTTIATTK
jgi:hypothetical protein